MFDSDKQLKNELRVLLKQFIDSDNVISPFKWFTDKFSLWGCDIFCLSLINSLYFFLCMYPKEQNIKFKLLRQTFADECKIGCYELMFMIQEDLSELRNINEKSTISYFDNELTDDMIEEVYLKFINNINIDSNIKITFALDVFKLLNKPENIRNKFLMLTILKLYERIILYSNEPYVNNDDLAWTNFEDFDEKEYKDFEFGYE